MEAIQLVARAAGDTQRRLIAHHRFRLSAARPQMVEPDLSQLRLGWCLWIVLVLVRAFWVCRVGH